MHSPMSQVDSKIQAQNVFLISLVHPHDSCGLQLQTLSLKRQWCTKVPHVYTAVLLAMTQVMQVLSIT